MPVRARAPARDIHNMSIKVMIIDGVADFRSLLMHHVTAHWPDAIITAYDPIEAGYLPDEFSGAGNDIILLRGSLGDREGVDVVKQFVKTPGIPPVVYFGEEVEEKLIKKVGADAFFVRDTIRHDAFVVRLSDLLAERNRAASTGSRPARTSTSRRTPIC